MEQRKRARYKLVCILALLLSLLSLLPASYATYFSDVSYSSQGTETHEAIMYVSDNGIMNGTGNENFSPGNLFTRAQVAQTLYNMAGSPAGSYTVPFTDVLPGAWYYNAVGWAYHNGITSGTSSTTFSPYNAVTRQQFATFLYRYATTIAGLSYNTSSFVSLSSYADGASVGNFAVLAMRWAATYCIIQPDSSNMLHPTASPYRREVALFICRYEKNAVGFFDGNKKYNGANVSASNQMTGTVQQRLFDLAYLVFPSNQADIIVSRIQNKESLSGSKCTGISFANFLDATGRHDFNRAVGQQSHAMSELGDYTNNARLRSAINFYQLGNELVYTHRTIAMTTGALDQFCTDLSVHGPTIIAFYWYSEATSVGHCVIATKAKKLNATTYEITICDPNYTTQKTKYLVLSNGDMSFYSHTLCSFEYYSSSAMQAIYYLDIDGQYNALAAN